VEQKKEAEVILFLNEFKSIVKKGGVYFVTRQEFIKTLTSFGITRSICQEELLSLSVEDYCQGPEEDRDRPGQVWIFGRRFQGTELYIKLKLAKVGKETIAKCLSFHPAGFSLCFPLRPAKEGEKNEEDMSILRSAKGDRGGREN
jgi:L-2-hydroxyglutarate oxidase LhgO